MSLLTKQAISLSPAQKITYDGAFGREDAV